MEQISDWLTKILLGATITQLGHVPEMSGRLFRNIAAGLDEADTAATFVGALLVYSVLFGFIFGWFTARTWIGPVIKAIQQSLEQSQQKDEDLGPTVAGQSTGPADTTKPTPRWSRRRPSPTDS